jgi:hypothetical protein
LRDEDRFCADGAQSPKARQEDRFLSLPQAGLTRRPLRGGKTATGKGEAKQKSVTEAGADYKGDKTAIRELAAYFGALPFFLSEKRRNINGVGMCCHRGRPRKLVPKESEKPGWFARLSYFETGSSILSYGPASQNPKFCSISAASHAGRCELSLSFVFSRYNLRCGFTGPQRLLHHHRQIFELVLQYWQSTSGHFDAASRIERGLWRNSIAPTHQKDLKQFSSFVGIDHSALQQIVPQRCQFGQREPVFVVLCYVHCLLVRHGRHHLRFRPFPSFAY